MKSQKLYSIFLITLVAFMFPNLSLEAQGVVNSGMISNSTTGTFRVKGNLRSTTAKNDSGLVNNGKIIVQDGSAQIQQDSVRGRVEFNSSNVSRQVVPQITYKDLRFDGSSEKLLDIVAHKRSLVVTDTLITTGSVGLKVETAYPIIANGKVTHDGDINIGTLTGKLIMNGGQAQPVDGKGAFKELELNNYSGADVINGGGFKVFSQLELTRGEMRNSVANNFTMGENSTIIRTTEGSIRTAPIFSTSVSVTYIGNGSISSGPEIPKDSTVLRDLRVQNVGVLSLTTSATVNNDLIVDSNVDTEPNGVRSVLTHNSTKNPIFASRDAEISGSIRRTQLVVGSPNVFNNQQTSIEFSSTTDVADTKEITVRVKPNVPSFPDQALEKVRRTIDITMNDANYQPVTVASVARVTYGWRLAPSDESNLIPLNEAQLQRHNGTQWNNVGKIVDTAKQFGNWAIGRDSGAIISGYYAIGRSGGNIRVVLNVNVLLEGAFRDGLMSMDLRQSGMIPRTPPNIYPYNLDPYREFITATAMPDTVIDWVVVELRTTQTGGKKIFKTGLLRNDGTVVEYFDTNSPIHVDSGTYYLVVHHRNHLAIMSKDPFQLLPAVASFYDFTVGANLFGSSAAGKLVDVTTSGRQYFAMIAGDVNGDGKIDRDDYDFSTLSTWQARDIEGYPNDFNANRANADADLNGVTTTRDVNTSWNNRGKSTFVPK